MTKDQIMQALRRLAHGFPNHPEVQELAESLSVVLAKSSCEHCVMPGGKHFEPCPNNPEPKRTRKPKAD